MSYLILFLGNRKKGLTEQHRKRLTDAVIAWGKQGGIIRRAMAIAAIFVILVYYHSIGKRVGEN